MSRNGLGNLFHQPAEFADFGGERIGAAARTRRRRHLDLHGIEAARNLGHLPRKIGGAARQIADLIAEVAAIAQAVADGIEQRHRGQGRQRHDGRRAGIDIETEIEHGANRGGDENHADRNEDSADTTHAVYPGPTPAAGAMPPERLIRAARHQCP